MLSWIDLLSGGIRAIAAGHPYWEERLGQLSSRPRPPYDLHLAVLVEPYLQLVLEGSKTVESRFSSRRSPPYHKVKRGDVILLKRSSGPILGICEVSDVWFYRLDPASWGLIRSEFTKAMCAQDPDFWRNREGASFATLMRIQEVTRISPINCEKRDRRGWVVLTADHHRLVQDS
jgi:hypothetical protein